MMRLAGTVARLPRYLQLAKALFNDAAIPVPRKAALAAGIGYAVLPFDILPGIIPIVGQLDDLAALLLGLRVALRGCPPETAAAHLQSAGVSRGQLDDDLRTVAVATLWIGRKTAQGGRKLVGSVGRLAMWMLRSRVQREAQPGPSSV